MSNRTPTDVLFQQVLDLILDAVPEHDRERITPTVALLENGLLDSFAFIRLIGALEEHFSIEIDPMNLDIQHFRNVASIVQWVEKSLPIPS
ncbi:MAG: acyl carrier protein [Magnetococcus sp. YQC-9]